MNEEFLENYIIENPQLKELIISNSFSLKSIPSSVNMLSKLQHIHIKSVPNLKNLPEELIYFTQLQTLSLKYVGIKSIDQAIFKHNDLQVLHLERTRIQVDNADRFPLRSVKKVGLIDTDKQNASILLNQSLPALNHLELKANTIPELPHFDAPCLAQCYISSPTIYSIAFLKNCLALKQLHLQGDLSNLKDAISLSLFLKESLDIQCANQAFIRPLRGLNISKKRKKAIIPYCLNIRQSDTWIHTIGERQLLDLSNLNERIANVALTELSDRMRASWNTSDFANQISHIHIAGRLGVQGAYLKKILKNLSIKITFKKGYMPSDENSCLLIGLNNGLTHLPDRPFLTEKILLDLLSSTYTNKKLSTKSIRELIRAKQQATIHLAIHLLAYHDIDNQTKIELVALYKLVNDQVLKRSLKKIITRFNLPNINRVISMKRKLKGNVPDPVRLKNLSLYSQLLKDEKAHFIQFALEWLKSNNH